MARVAKAEPGTVIYTEGQTFDFSDGSRQVTQAEEESLRNYLRNGGTAKLTFVDSKSKGAK